MSAATSPGAPSTRRGVAVIVVGAGFGGIAAAIELRRHGIEDVTILERAPELGGTWYYNTYPGCACDVASQLYSFSFAQRRDWKRVCSPAAEIHEYLREVARDYGVEELIHTGTTVTGCSWDSERCRWVVETAERGSFEGDALVLATGQLDEPAIPAIEGAERFAGHSFHSAHWDHDYALAGKRVAVIGTGASAVQFVPLIAPACARLSVFQRTGNWFLPRENSPYPRLLRRAIETVPGLQALRRRFIYEYAESLTLAIRHPRTVGRLYAAASTAFMRKQLPDRALRARVWPNYVFGCKRVLFSSDFLPALQRENVELVTEHIEELTPQGIRTADGELRELDCVIWATGFQTNRFMVGIEVHGTGEESLRERWASGPHAHLGMTVPSFPNMFVMYGPNTNTSGGSIIVYLEAQAAYIRQALEQLRDRGAAAIEVREEVEAASDRAVQQRFAGTAWLDCQSWYRDENGRIVANWPGYMREYVERTRTLDPDEFRFARLRERVTAGS